MFAPLSQRSRTPWRARATASLLWFVAACATTPPAPTGLLPQPDADGNVWAHVEHGVDTCAACERGERCLDASHWHYRFRDRVLPGHHLREALRELAQRFPEEGLKEGEPFFSSVALLIRAQGDTSYASVQRLIQLAAAAGMYKIEVIVTPPPTREPAESSDTMPEGQSSGTDFRIAIHWDEEKRSTRLQVGLAHPVDDEELRALMKGACVGGRFPTLVIDAADLVPWCEVLRMIHMARRMGWPKVEFASGKRYQ